MKSMPPAGTLRVGGLTPLTTVDFPGELAAVIYCRGCPWRCRYCQNGHLLETAGDTLDWQDVMALLKTRRGLLDGVVFSGGEPTLQNALAPAMAAVRRLGFKIGLHTGGPYPARLQPLLAHVDWVGLDIKALPEDYPTVTGVAGSGAGAWSSLQLLLAADVDLEVRTTPLAGLDDDAYLQRLAQALSAEGVAEWTLQQCRADRMPAPVSASPRPLHAEHPTGLSDAMQVRIR